MRALLASYYGSVTYKAFPFRVVESDVSRSYRSEIELAMPKCIEVIRATARIPLTRLVPAERPGKIEQVNLLSVVFELDRHSLDRTQVFEVLDAALELYRLDMVRALLRTFNPLYWLDMALALVEVLPFWTVRRFGFDAAGAARSPGGVALRVTVRLAGLATIVLLLLTAFGLRGEAGRVAVDLIDLLARWARRAQSAW